MVKKGSNIKNFINLNSVISLNNVKIRKKGLFE
jgi:hypothetical protein